MCQRGVFSSFYFQQSSVVLLCKRAVGGWKGYVIDCEGVMRVHVSHQSQCGLYQRVHQIKNKIVSTLIWRCVREL